MLETITGEAVPGSLAESIHRQTEGNPLFVQEVVRYLVEEGHLGHGQGAAALSSIAIPEGLRDVIGRRLSRLSPECNRVLAVAAVIGRDFDLETLQAVAEGPEEQVVAALEESVRVGVLEEQSRPGVIRYRFAHAFFRQTLYEEMIAPRRLRLHQQVAAALEKQYARRLDEHAAELAEHFAQSTGRQNLRKAVRYGELAAERAMTVYAYGEAARHIEQALAVQEVLDPDDKAKRCDLLLALADALLPAGESSRVVSAIAPEALALAEASGDRERASRACQDALEATLGLTGAAGSGAEQYKYWADAADRFAAPGSTDRVSADSALSMVAYSTERQAEAWQLAQKALALSRALQNSEALCQAAGRVVLANWSAQHQEERLRLAEELASRSSEGVKTVTMGHMLFGCGAAFLTWGLRPQAEEVALRMRELADRTREWHSFTQAAVREAQFLAIDGQLEASVEAADLLRGRADDLGNPGWVRQLAFRAALWPLLHLGRPEQALADQPPGSRAAATSGRSMTYVSTLALCLAHLERWDDVRDLLDQFRGRFEGRDADYEPPILPLVHFLITAILVEDKSLTRSLVEALSPCAHWLSDVYPTCIARHLGKGRMILAEPEEARVCYLKALEICERVRFRPEIALTRLELAELLLEHYPDERTTAIEHLDFAIGEFRDMKMQPSLERALRHKEVLGA
jgi:hypothetical protein